jgi:branched-chain amino acid transport system ATP-binding protein
VACLQRLHLTRPELCVVITESNCSLLKDIPTDTLVIERGELQRTDAADTLAH